MELKNIIETSKTQWNLCIGTCMDIANKRELKSKKKKCTKG